MSSEIHLSGMTTVDGNQVWLAVTENRWNKFLGQYLEPAEYRYYAFLKGPNEKVRELYGDSARSLFNEYNSQVRTRIHLQEQCES